MSNEPVDVSLRKVFVGGTLRTTTEQTISNYFSKYGVVTSVGLMKDQAGVSRGFAFISFEDDLAVDNMLKNRPHIIDGKEVEVKRAMPRDITDPSVHERTSKVFIGGLPADATKEDLINYYNERYQGFGSVTNVEVKVDKESGKPRGFMFVTFDNNDVVDRVMIEDRFPIIKNKRCEVKKARPLGERSERDAPGDGRFGFRGGRVSTGGRGGFARGRGSAMGTSAPAYSRMGAYGTVGAYDGYGNGYDAGYSHMYGVQPGYDMPTAYPSAYPAGYGDPSYGYGGTMAAGYGANPIGYDYSAYSQTTANYGPSQRGRWARPRPY